MFVNTILFKIFMWDLVLKNLLQETEWCNQNLIWMITLVVMTFLVYLRSLLRDVREVVLSVQ